MFEANKRTFYYQVNRTYDKMKPTVISLFAGGGGDTLGFVNSGFNLVFANDNNPDACNTLRNRFGKKIIYHGDIRKLDNFVSGNVITGGFPCQGFSVAGSRKTNDERNNLYRELKRAINTVKPEFFVAENVKGFITIGENVKKSYFKDGKIIVLGKIAQMVIDEFEMIGYKTHYELHNAKDFGLPQDRERIIIVGVRKDIKFDFKFPIPTHKNKPLSMEQYGIKKIKIKDSEIYREPKGKRKDYFSSRYMSRNRIRKWSQPSFTIPAEASQVPSCPDCSKMWDKNSFNTNRPSDSEMIKNFEKYHKYIASDLRRLSWRQCAAIQGFPDDYEFSGGLISIYKQIGNAVPPKLMEQIAKCIMPYFKGKNESYSGSSTD